VMQLLVEMVLLQRVFGSSFAQVPEVQMAHNSLMNLQTGNAKRSTPQAGRAELLFELCPAIWILC